MANFIMYMIFSGLEFLAVFMIIFSLFNIDYRYYIKESLLGVSLVTIVSYFLTIWDLHKIVPMPLFLTMVISLLLKFLFLKKIKYASIVSIGASLLYGVIQWTVGNVAVSSLFISSNQINDPFSFKTYVMQSICTLIAVIIALYIKLCQGGFGFELRKGNDTKLIASVITMFFISSILSHDRIVNGDVLGQYFILISLILSTTIFFVLSYNRDKYEFTL